LVIIYFDLLNFVVNYQPLFGETLLLSVSYTPNYTIHLT